MDEIINFIKEKIKWFLLGLVGIIVMLLILLFWQVFQSDSKEEPAEMSVYEELLLEEEGDVEENSEEEVAVPQEAPSADIIVDVKGAVQAPGVYTMNTNSRVIDAIEKAGGLVAEAEEKAVNLAQIVEDQMVIYVPTEGEALENGNSEIIASQTADREDSTDTIDINRAEKEALMTLNGIGDSKADNIIAYREENGNFQTIEDIKNVSGIGEATFDNLKDFIHVGP